MAILYIDTTKNTEVVVGLCIDGKTYMLKRKMEQKSSKVILPLIEELLSLHKKTITDITQITVQTGPGSFTGVRIGVSIANALGFALKIPVNGGPSVAPLYS